LVLRTYRSLLYHSVLDRFNNASIAIRQTEHAVLPQDAVSDVFQLCDHSKSRVRAPFNEIRLAFHRLTSFFLISCTAEIGQLRRCDDLVGVSSPSIRTLGLCLSLHVERRS
jgi:hypothetical protein